MKAILRTLIPVAAIVAALFSIPSTTVVAQDAEPGPLASIGEDLWRQASRCWDCHGNMGNGMNEDPRSPKGADFRRTMLTWEQIAEVIKCGRPGTPMPYFFRNAYEGANPCYGVTIADLGAAAPPAGAPQYNQRQIDALAQFIHYEYVGRGPATQEECREFFGDSASSCNRWPTRAEVEAAADAEGEDEAAGAEHGG
ncbi:MAG: hypothetical protein KIS96_14835 [Bauldia sp.]|nr:hypothetical protein [Bauldia sp.]